MNTNRCSGSLTSTTTEGRGEASTRQSEAKKSPSERSIKGGGGRKGEKGLFLSPSPCFADCGFVLGNSVGIM